MQRWLTPIFSILFLGVVSTSVVHAQGVMIPANKEIAPLTMVSHQVEVNIEDQVAVTKVTQVFHNPADRALEATYVFPVPKGASVRKFTMWVDGKEVNGELVEAEKAKGIYTDIVRRMQDPGLLEYVGTNLLQLKVFPVPARGDQKVALSFTSVADQDAGLVEYTYPLKADAGERRGVSPPCHFSAEVTLKSQHTLQNIYSPSHGINIKRVNDHEAKVSLNNDDSTKGHDFQLFYTLSDKDVGLTMLPYRPDGSSDGYFMLLVSPRAELDQTQKVARDMVFVLDTSGSMAGVKMEQAKKALKFCLSNLDKGDRFSVMNFSTTVHTYSDGLIESSSEQIERAKKWVDNLQATGGTAIDDALATALKLRSDDTSRTFTMVFFTDGQPTVGETNCDKILKNVMDKNTKSTRIFTFGVGDDVNAHFLDKLADETRACSSYVRPEEDIEVKVSSLYAKISHPVMTNLKLTAESILHNNEKYSEQLLRGECGVKLSEIYPVHLPDLFHGSQVVVLGKYHGQGHAVLKLTGEVGNQTREFEYNVKLPEKTDDARSFVEDLWARRKVGYLLDQIRSNGENKELVDEVVSLAKKHGIVTPYTSYLVVPDTAVPVTTPNSTVTGSNLTVPVPGGYAAPGVSNASAPQGLSQKHMQAAFGIHQLPPLAEAPRMAPMHVEVDSTSAGSASAGAKYDQHLFDGQFTQPTFPTSDLQTGKTGVDMALYLNDLRNQNQVTAKANRTANGRNCFNINGVWIDEHFNAKVKTLNVKAQSDAYFRILDKHPEMKSVFQLGNRVVWIAPNGVALIIDPTEGKESLDNDEIDKLFVAAK